MFPNKLKGFSTVEGIISGVILSIAMALVYSTFSNINNSNATLKILRGIECYETWLTASSDNMLTDKKTTIDFTGGKTIITLNNHAEIAGLFDIDIKIVNNENKSMIEWSELRYLP